MQAREKVFSTNQQKATNRLLAALPQPEYQLLARRWQKVFLEKEHVLYQYGEPITHVYFLTQGIVSLISTIENGAMTEIGVIGQEGIVGLPIFLGSSTARETAVVQISGTAVRLNAETFKVCLRQASHLQSYLLLFTQILLSQISNTAIYNSLYPVHARLARWLLLINDLTQLNPLFLTQEYIALMLGVRRASVTNAASSLSREKIISYNRGCITILDCQALEEKAGDTYSLFQKELEQFFIVLSS